MNYLLCREAANPVNICTFQQKLSSKNSVKEWIDNAMILFEVDDLNNIGTLAATGASEEYSGIRLIL